MGVFLAANQSDTQLYQALSGSALHFPPGVPAEVYGPPPLLLASHLFLGDGHRALEDDPLDGVAAGRRGEGAVVDEVLVRGVWQKASQDEGRHLGALTWGAHGAVGVSAAERVATAEEKEMEKNTRQDEMDMRKKKGTGSAKRRTVSAHAVDAVNDGGVVLVLLIARLRTENQRKRLTLAV